MFDSSYAYKVISRERGFPKLTDYKNAWLYFFDDKLSNRYIVRLKEFEYDVYFIKFHQRKDKNSHNKYRVETHVNDSMKIIGTCLQIMLDFLEEKCEVASFGAVGVSSLDEQEEGRSQRFRIYELLFKNIFSDVDFIHADMPDSSATFIINRKTDVEKVLSYLAQLFE
ncbi:MAG: hypothetical protein AAF849_11760 [Bacteroidota bacterium]